MGAKCTRRAASLHGTLCPRPSSSVALAAAWTSLQDLPLGNIPEVSPGQGVVGRFVGLHPSLEALLNSPLESGRHVGRCPVTVSRCLAKRFCGCHSGF